MEKIIRILCKIKYNFITELCLMIGQSCHDSGVGAESVLTRIT